MFQLKQIYSTVQFWRSLWLAGNVHSQSHKAQGLCVFSEKQFFLQHLNIGNVRGLAAAAALSADFSALRVFWSLLFVRLQRSLLPVESEQKQFHICYSIWELVRFVMGVLMCSQGLVNTAGISN